jgi:large subunit ribosomal protein L33
LPFVRVGGLWVLASSPRSWSKDGMPKKANRMVVTLACTECKERNYTTMKNRKNDSGRMELKKYCPQCKVHRLHRESK